MISPMLVPMFPLWEGVGRWCPHLNTVGVRQRPFNNLADEMQKSLGQSRWSPHGRRDRRIPPRIPQKNNNTRKRKTQTYTRTNKALYCILQKPTLDIVLASGGSNKQMCYLIGQETKMTYQTFNIYSVSVSVTPPNLCPSAPMHPQMWSCSSPSRFPLSLVKLVV